MYIVELISKIDNTPHTTRCEDEQELRYLVSNIDKENYTLINMGLVETEDYKKFCKDNSELELGDTSEEKTDA